MYKVLLVDDERLELNTLKNYVDWTKLGIGTVYTANNGLQALETAEFKKPDIVFTDIRMPVMDGIEFARQLREKDKRVKIIFLTGYDEMDFIRLISTTERRESVFSSHTSPPDSL
ncbi:response regulator, partial [Eisenbergiella tayi]|uniref:response regulator n=1 Tax=Eisenbergiella tayi TaxID=1432052 RepID=UPI003AF02F30